MSRRTTIIWSTIAGAAIGSSLGIAGFGDAIAATIPFAAIGAALAFLYTRPTPEGTPTPIKEIRSHAVPMVLHFLASCWNMLMRMLIALRLMPFFIQRPWLLIVLVFMLMALLPFAAIFFVALGGVALHYKVEASEKFMITLPAA